MPTDLPINLKTLHKSLLAAYPEYNDLARLLYYDCDVALGDIVQGGTGQSDVVYAVIRSARSKGWLIKLVLAAAADLPDNAQLAEMAQAVDPSDDRSTNEQVPSPPSSGSMSVSPSPFQGEGWGGVASEPASPEPPSPSLLTVFLSHGSEDKGAAIKLYDDLSASGVKPWLDVKELVPGQRWRARTLKAVRECDVVIVCVTASSTSRDGFLHKEIAEALDAAEGKPEESIYVIPLRLEKCDVPDRLSEWHWLNYYEADGHDQLLRALTHKATELGRMQPQNQPHPEESKTPLNPPVSGVKQESEATSPQPTGPEVTPKGEGVSEPTSVPASAVHSVAHPSPIADPPHVTPEAARLVATMENVSVSFKDRVAAGLRLAEIGDPRPGVGLRSDGLPDIVWCDVPAGEFVFQDGQKRTLTAFRIAKYPITYRQFQSFVGASDGYSDSRWWDGLHADGLAQQRRGPGNQAFKFDNHPRENVSWHDAMAFCRWMSARLGITVLLPTEVQWEKAARGTEGRVYPYGDKFDPTKGNTQQSGIGQTSAVGAFSDGVSPYGAHDMSGNVWEWTLTEYGRRSDANVSSNARRAVRGGSWSDGGHGARAAYRYSYFPGARGSYIGFRLACPADFL